jgi:sterol 14alpha-demethylase
MGSSGEVDLVTLTSRVILGISVRTFLGDEFWRCSEGQFEQLYRDLAAGLDPMLPGWLPIPRYRRRDRARAELRRIFGAFLERRRRDPDPPDDFFKRLLAMRLPDGSSPSAEDLTNLVTLMIFGSHDTSASALTWTLIHMLQNRSYLRRVVEQRDDVMRGEEAIGAEALRSCDLLDAALKETERLHPVPAVLMRVVAKTVRVGGYEVPKGWLMMVSPAVSHRLPELFADPNTYNPDRFLSGGNNLHQHLIGFGGGVHHCWGRHFAQTEIKILLVLLLGRYDLELVTPDPQTDNLQFSRHPLQPCMVRYTRRKVATRADALPVLTPPPQSWTSRARS